MERDEELPEWEKSKENVQPRKYGRSVGKLNAGLCARTEGDLSLQLRAEKEKYEAALRCYEGDDPLSVWYDYIIWTEENFPSGGKSTCLQELLTSCVKEFEHSDKYKDDDRFIEIWITFAGKCKEPQDVYKHMNNKKIGLRSANFYKTWALTMEEQGEKKMADKIFLQGLENGAKPKDVLKRAREEFETRTCRVVMQNMAIRDKPEKNEGAQRQTLVPLACSSKGRVPHDRATAARPGLSTEIGAVRRSAPQKPLQVFAGGDELEQATVKDIRGKPVLPDSKENVLAASKWTEAGKKHISQHSTRPTASTEAKFDVHTDAASSKASAHPHNVIPGLGLSMKKVGKKVEEGPCQTYVMTSHEPGEIIQELPMYSKTKVYAGVTEYSFEELRAIKWQKREEKRQVEEEHQAAISALKELKRKLVEELINDMHAVREELLSELDKRTQRILSAAETVSKMSTSAEVGYKTPNDKASFNASSVSTKRHRTPDTSSAKRSFFRTASFSETQECAQAVKRFYNQTLSMEPHQPFGSQPRGNDEASREAVAGFVVYADEPSAVHSPVHTEEPAVSKIGGSTLSAFKKPTSRLTQQVKPVAGSTVSADKTEGLAQTDHVEKQANEQDSQRTSVSRYSGFTVNSGVPPTTCVPAGQSHSQPLDGPSSAPASAFAVFADESELVTEKPLREVAHVDLSQDKVPAIRENICNPAHASASRTGTGSESMDYQTDFDLRVKFGQQAHTASTPFVSSERATMPDVGVSEIRPQRTLPVSNRLSINQVEFPTTTHILSPITERSRELASASSQSAASSDASTGASLATSRTFSSSAKTGSRCSSESECAEESHTDQAIPANKSKHHHAPPLDVVTEDSAEVLERATPVIDTTFYQPAELTEAQLNTTIIIDSSDPFSDSLQGKLLRKVDISTYKKVKVVAELIPKIKVGSKVDMPEYVLKVTGKLGAGGFANIFKAVLMEKKINSDNTADMSKMSNIATGSPYEVSSQVCVKVQQPACPWELYICRELADRMSCMDSDVTRDINTRVMSIDSAVFYTNGSLMVNDLVANGSLLNLVNAVKAKHKKIPEALVMYITIELLHTIEVLHRCKVIHGDVKPDNVLFLGFPLIRESDPFANSSIKLIDFGRGIDMSKFPPGTTFTASNQTEGFMCVEMKTHQPWTYQTDLFGLLGTVFPLLFNTYMQVQYRNGRWQPDPFDLHRSYKSSLWRKLFDEFLNVPSCDDIPDIAAWREAFEQEFTVLFKDYMRSYSAVNSLLSHYK